MVAAWQLTPQLSTYVKVDNLFDETYIAARRPAGVRPGLPRPAYLGLTYRLSAVLQEPAWCGPCRTFFYSTKRVTALERRNNFV